LVASGRFVEQLLLEDVLLHLLFLLCVDKVNLHVLNLGVLLANQVLVDTNLLVEFLQLRLNSVELLLVLLDFPIDFVIQLLLLLDFARQSDRHLSLLEDVLVCQVNRIFDSLGVDLAVLESFVALEQLLKFLDHSLNYLHSEIHGLLEFFDQLAQLLLQVSCFHLVCLKQKLRV